MELVDHGIPGSCWSGSCLFHGCSGLKGSLENDPLISASQWWEVGETDIIHVSFTSNYLGAISTGAGTKNDTTPPTLKWFPLYTGFTVQFNGSQHPLYTNCSGAPCIFHFENTVLVFRKHDFSESPVHGKFWMLKFSHDLEIPNFSWL